jgi:hypothetical protein
MPPLALVDRSRDKMQIILKLFGLSHLLFLAHRELYDIEYIGGDQALFLGKRATAMARLGRRDAHRRGAEGAEVNQKRCAVESIARSAKKARADCLSGGGVLPKRDVSGR